MQAISVKYLGPTNARGARMVARCNAGRITVAWDHSMSPSDNARTACLTLLRKLGWWERTFTGGLLPDGTWAFVTDDAWTFPGREVRVRLVKS